MYLEAFNVSTDEHWVWAAVGYLAGAYLFLGFVSNLVLSTVRHCAPPPPPAPSLHPSLTRAHVRVPAAALRRARGHVSR